MTPKGKFLLVCVALAVPYVLGLLILVSKYPPDHLPEWALVGAGAYLVVALCSLVLFSKIIFKREPGPPSEEELQRANWSRSAAKRLLVLWGVLFVYGAWETLKGEIPTARAVPAAILLLTFVSVFAYPLWRGRHQDDQPTDASSGWRAK